jgi:hypothetical protein
MMYSILVTIPLHGRLYKAGFTSPESAWEWYVARCRPGVATEILITKHEE